MDIVAAWYGKRRWLWVLWPVSVLYQWLAARRRRILERSRHESSAPPVVVIGNIAVGGTGKTPLLMMLARALQARGVRVGVVSRGYGGHPPASPFKVTVTSAVAEVGDEALMMQRALDVPFYVDAKRARAVAALAATGECDLILSDDGLQHYEMARARELVVIDGERLFGNGLCLPAGPLREPLNRLREVDYVLINGEQRSANAKLPPLRAGRHPLAMSLVPVAWVNLASGARVALDALPVPPSGTLHALAGIGNPARFFATVEALGYRACTHPFPDHHPFSPSDLAFAGEDLVVMTSKDAVKCEAFAKQTYWMLAVEAQLEATALDALCHDLTGLLRSAGTDATTQEE